MADSEGGGGAFDWEAARVRAEEILQQSTAYLGTLQGQKAAVDGIAVEANGVLQGIRSIVDQIEEYRRRLQAAVSSAEEDSVAARARIATALGQSETASQAAGVAKTEAEEATRAIAEARKAAQAELDETGRLKAAVQSAAAVAAEQRTAASNEATAAAASRTSADTSLQETQKLRARAEEELRSGEASSKTLAGLAAKAAAAETKLAEYEAQLAALIGRASEDAVALKTRIEGLLPGATSAGLAAAFEARKNAVIANQARWRRLFYGSLAGLFLIAPFAAGIVHANWLSLGADPTPGGWQGDLLFIIRRLSLLAVPIWLAIFSQRQLKTLLRLEEEYAHKVVMSNSFEGYKRELAGLGEKTLALHTEAVIEVLRQSPVRLYEGTSQGDTPAGVAVENATKLIDSVKDFTIDITNKVLKR